jgi:fucose permease
MEQIGIELFALIWPIIGTFVSTIMGTAVFKRFFPDVNARVVTWVVIGILVVVVGLVLSWLPSWLVFAIGIFSAGFYSQVIKLPESLSDQSKKIGGGGGYFRPR